MLLAVAALSAAGARAQEPDFFEQGDVYFRHQTVEGASKHTESALETPATVTIVERDDLERYGLRTIADVLNFASVGYFTHNDRRYDFGGGRGQFLFEDFNTRILVLLNGHPLNEPWNNFGGLGREMVVPLDLADRVEVIYGPSALFYGGYSLYGIVNVVTSTGGTLAGTRIRVAGGTWGTREASASYGATGTFGAGDEEGKATTWDLLAAVGRYASDGEDLDLPRIPVSYPVDFQGGTVWGGPQSGTDFERSPFAFLRARAGEVTVTARAGYREHGAPLAPYESVYGSRAESVRDDKSYVEVRWDHALAAHVDLAVRGFYDWYRYREQDPYADDQTYPGEIGYDFHLDASSADVGAEARVSARLGTHYLSAGAEHRRREVGRDSFNELFSGATDEASRIRESIDGHFTVTYAQDEWRPIEGLTLIAGGNWADTDPGGSKAQPRLAVIGRPQPDVSLKALWGRGFRPPSIFEADYSDFQGDIANPSLRSEEIESTELSALWNAGRSVAVQAYVFRSVIDGVISAVTIQDLSQVQGGVVAPSGDPADLVGQLQYQGVGGLRASGAGASAHARRGRLRGYANVAFSRSTFEPVGAPDSDLPATPSWLASAGVSCDVRDVTLSLVGRYVGPQDLDPSRPTSGEAGDFTEVNAHVRWRPPLRHPMSLFLDVRNVFDTDAALPASPIYSGPVVPIEGRRADVGVEVQF